MVWRWRGWWTTQPLAMTDQNTLVMVKPDGVQRRLTGRILQLILRNGLEVPWMSYARLSVITAATLYREHIDKPHYGDLVYHMSSPPGVVPMLVCGEDAVNRAREIVLHIRRDLATSRRCNVVHASATIVDAERELALMFGGTQQ